MKHIIIAIYSIFFLTAGFAQPSTIPQPNGNIINNTLNKFTGTWQWENGVDTITIFLKKENILLLFPQNSHADYIVGYHSYKRGSQIIESSLQYNNSSYVDKYYSISALNDNGNDTLRGSLKDLTKQKSGSLELSLNSTHTQLHWNLKNRQGLRIGTYDWQFTLPKTLILTKQ